MKKLIALLLCAMVLAGCGGAKEETASAESAVSVTEAPTETPTPEPTDEPTPEPTKTPEPTPEGTATPEPTAAPTEAPAKEIHYTDGTVADSIGSVKWEVPDGWYRMSFDDHSVVYAPRGSDDDSILFTMIFQETKWPGEDLEGVLLIAGAEAIEKGVVGDELHNAKEVTIANGKTIGLSYFKGYGFEIESAYMFVNEDLGVGCAMKADEGQLSTEYINDFEYILTSMTAEE